MLFSKHKAEDHGILYAAAKSALPGRISRESFCRDAPRRFCFRGVFGLHSQWKTGQIFQAFEHLLSHLPPEIVFRGYNPSHEVKCLTVLHLFISKIFQGRSPKWSYPLRPPVTQRRPAAPAPHRSPPSAFKQQSPAKAGGCSIYPCLIRLSQKIRFFPARKAVVGTSPTHSILFFHSRRAEMEGACIWVRSALSRSCSPDNSNIPGGGA